MTPSTTSRFPDFFLGLGAESGRVAPAKRCLGHTRTEVKGDGWILVMDVPPRAPTGCSWLSAGPWRFLALGELLGYRRQRLDGARALAAFAGDLLEGREDPSSLGGHFVLLALDEKASEARVWTNRCGTWHAYALGGSAGGPVRALGTYTPALYERSRRQLDWAGLAGFFANGFYPGDRTHYDDVRVLRPGTTYRVDLATGRLEQARYFHWRHQPEEIDGQQAVEEVRDVFDATMRHVADVPIAGLPISGGLDSRCTVAALAPAEGLWPYSYGYHASSIELRIAAEVAAARDLPLSTFVIGPYLFDRMNDVLAATEGFVDVTQSRQVAIAEQLGARAGHVIAAHWGDVWFDDMSLVGEPATTDVAALANKKFRKRGSDWLLEHVIGRRLGQDPGQIVRDHIADELGRLAHIEDPDFRLKLLKTEQWSFRWTMTSLRTYQLGSLPRLPFYQPELVDLFCRLPTRVVAGRMLQVEYLRRFAPDLARVHWQAFGSHLFDYPHVDPNRLWRRVTRRAWRTVRGPRVPERNWETQLSGPAGRVGIARLLLDPGRRVFEYVPAVKVRELVARFERERSPQLGYTVSALVTFAAWLEAQP